MKPHRYVAAKLASSPESSPSGLGVTGLGPLLEQAPKRLFALTVSLGLLSLVGLVLNVIGPSQFGWNEACAQAGMLIHSALLVLSLMFAGSLLWANLDDKTYVHLGMAYLVLMSFGISYSELSYPKGGISFVAILIVLYPLFVPATPRITALTTFSAAATAPLAVGLYTALVGEVPVEGVGTRFFFNFFVAALAVMPSKIMCKLGRDVTRARQMGSYELDELIGKGGMGEVWRASHRMLRRPAAIKLIHPHALGAVGDSQALTMLKRFEREAQSTAGLHSPHTIDVYDFGTTDAGDFFYVMELLEGFDLDTLVERFGPVPPERAVFILKQICDSLEDAHRSDLIHRDIKPANVFVCRYGYRLDFVKVLDFGLVKSSPSATSEDTRLTVEGTAPGTPACMAPEVALGEEVVDARADIYALGCVAYWLLTGQLVFDAPSNMKMVLKHVQETPVPPSQRTEMDIPETLDDIVMACLEKQPENRPQSAMDLADRLATIELEQHWTENRASSWWQAHSPAPTTASEPGLRLADTEGALRTTAAV